MPSSDLFGDLIDELEEYQHLFEDYSRSVIPFVNEVKDTLEWRVANILVENARSSMSSIDEYNNGLSQPLVNQLIGNLLDERADGGPKHVKLTSDFGFEIFDEEHAGTYEDLLSAHYEVDDPERAAFYWKFGIYKPSVEGYTLTITKKDKKGNTKTRQIKTVSYSKVIRERLSVWGKKAPYWFFIEHGNQGTGREYPSFGGRPFIYPTEVLAREELRLFEQDILDMIDRQLDEDVSSISTGDGPFLPQAGQALNKLVAGFKSLFRRR